MIKIRQQKFENSNIISNVRSYVDHVTAAAKKYGKDFNANGRIADKWLMERECVEAIEENINGHDH